MSQYSLLNRVADPVMREMIKLLMDRLRTLETAAGGIGAVSKPLSAALDSGGHRLTSIADPSANTDAVSLQYLRKYVDAAILRSIKEQAAADAAAEAAPGALPPASPGPGLTVYTDLAVAQPTGVPAAPNLRWFRGDFCGIHVAGLPAVAGGAADSTLLLTPFIDRYDAATQAACVAAYKAKGYTHWKLWWPDSRDGAGQSEAQFVATCQMLLSNGLYPVPFLYSKAYDEVDPDPAKCDGLIAALQAGGVDQIMCVGGELDLFNTPGAPLQALIDHIAGLVVPTTNLYVHFSPGYVAWQAPGELGSAFWNANVGKLTGLLHQKMPEWDAGMYQARLADLIIRFGDGVSGWPTDSGLGHPFDIVADEYSAPARFDGNLSETAAQTMGNWAICSQTQGGGAPTIPIMGFNNGGPIV